MHQLAGCIPCKHSKLNIIPCLVKLNLHLHYSWYTDDFMVMSWLVWAVYGRFAVNFFRHFLVFLFRPQFTSFHQVSPRGPFKVTSSSLQGLLFASCFKLFLPLSAVAVSLLHELGTPPPLPAWILWHHAWESGQTYNIVTKFTSCNLFHGTFYLLYAAYPYENGSGPCSFPMTKGQTWNPYLWKICQISHWNGLVHFIFKICVICQRD